MALDADRLGDAIVDRLKLLNPKIGAALFGGSAAETDLRTTWKAISDEIVSEFKDNAEVATTVTGTLPNGVENASGTGDLT